MGDYKANGESRRVKPEEASKTSRQHKQGRGARQLECLLLMANPGYQLDPIWNQLKPKQTGRGFSRLNHLRWKSRSHVLMAVFIKMAWKKEGFVCFPLAVISALIAKTSLC